MNIVVAISDDLDISSDQFIHRWNSDVDASAVAAAESLDGPRDRYDLGPWLDATVAVLGSIASGLATSIIYDMLSKILKPFAAHRELSYRREERPDGTVIVEVRVPVD